MCLCVYVVSVSVAMLSAMLMFGAVGGVVLALWDVAVGVSTTPHALLLIGMHICLGLAALVAMVTALRVHDGFDAGLL